MGYSETHCQICGVSFNIGRIRKKHEPLSAAWQYFGSSFVEVDGFDCTSYAGCLYYKRESEEYKSPFKSNHEQREARAVDVESCSTQCDDMGDDIRSNFGSDEGLELEHIAGPGCCIDGGYNGNHISVQEMRACQTYQALIRKPLALPDVDANGDEHDRQFKSVLGYFLSGLSDSMDSRDSGLNGEYRPPNRYDVNHMPDNHFFREDYIEMVALPFHPACLEIWKRASLFRQGTTDMEGLIGWWQHDGIEYDTWTNFPRADGIRELQQQWWHHQRGTEYVAANPLFPLFLPNVISSVISPVGLASSTGAFQLPSEYMAQPSNTDPFGGLPLEIRLIILSHLSAQDIANIRLTSRTFRQLPISVFHDLILREMPWLWEASPKLSSLLYSFWAAKDSTTPRIAKDIDDHENEFKSVPVPNILPINRTDWFKLFCTIKREMKNGNLKGLQNRRRIWTDCQEALRRIEEYRANGELPITDLRGLIRQHQEAKAEKRRLEAIARRKNDLEN